MFVWLPILKPLIDFFCLIPLANAFSTVLSSSKDSRYLCPVPDFNRNVSSISPLNKIQVLGLKCIYVCEWLWHRVLGIWIEHGNRN